MEASPRVHRRRAFEPASLFAGPPVGLPASTEGSFLAVSSLARLLFRSWDPPRRHPLRVAPPPPPRLRHPPAPKDRSKTAIIAVLPPVFRTRSPTHVPRGAPPAPLRIPLSLLSPRVRISNGSRGIPAQAIRVGKALACRTLDVLRKGAHTCAIRRSLAEGGTPRSRSRTGEGRTRTWTKERSRKTQTGGATGGGKTSEPPHVTCRRTLSSAWKDA
eukprot:scaffold324_cov326-Pavlova_lutheri.AAC.85